MPGQPFYTGQSKNAGLKINNKCLKICVKHLVSDKKKTSSYVPNLAVHKAQVIILLPPVLPNSVLKLGCVMHSSRFRRKRKDKMIMTLCP